VQPESFVGGVSDGTYGAAAMVFDQTEVFPRVNGTYGVAGIVYDQSFLLNRIQTQGRKAWFFFDREMVALGAGITSSRAERIGTTLNQTLLHGPVLIDGHTVEPGLSKVPQSSGVLHDEVGYAFLGPAAASVKVGPQTGDWQSISASNPDTPVTESVFSLWIDHGMRPQDAKYAYAVLPGINAQQLAEWVARPPVRVITNTTDQQAVINDQLGVAEIIFYGHGKVALSKESTVEVDRRCFVLMVAHDKATRIALSSSGGEATVVHLTLTTPQSRQRVTFELPGGDLRGKSTVMEVPMRW
jgi:chondroitin AC lyase